MPNSTHLSGQDVFDRAPLGALLRYSDGTPEPPIRFTRKHAAWQRNNATGVLITKSAGRKSPSYEIPASFTLHKGTLGTADYPVIIYRATYLVTSSLQFEILQTPAAGSVLILDSYGEDPELLHVAPNQDAAASWIVRHHYPDALTQEIPEAA